MSLPAGDVGGFAPGTPVAMATGMMNATTATVSFHDDVLDVAIHDELAESVGVFAALDARTRDRLAADAWRIGLRAMSVAHAKAEEAKLSDVGRTLIAEVEHQLERHLTAQQQGWAEALRQYFDPSDGRLAERLDAAVGERGALAGVLERFVGPSSVLAQTLARNVGAESEIFKRLSPTDSEGLVKVIEGKLAEVLARNQHELGRALDPLVPDGALAKLLRQLRDEVSAAGAGQAAQLQAAMAALDANDEQSAISRMMREAGQARRDLLGALNPRDPSTPLGAIDATVRELLAGQAERLATFQEEVRARQELFDRDVRLALARIETGRQRDARNPDGGNTFEGQVGAFIAERLRNAPIMFEPVGKAGRCKVGDFVLRHTAEGAFAGAALVVEAKHDASYTVPKALAELDEARANREASAGLLVMATSHAKATFPRFARHGQNVLVCWDPEDPASDAWLDAALTLGLYLVGRSKAVDSGDLRALADVEKRIGAELERIDRLEKHNRKIEDGSDGIATELRKAKKELQVLLDKAKSTLRALDVTLDERQERESPLFVALSDSSDRLQ
ncbi:MAG: hypothetical protein KBG48_05640 [Kofleriaceae bacterium]|nr:hypothetical protein [Kofleriaceae bacterium]MBP9166846.1 hypothetical protein [Kofleriaceae bacterium]MBP9859977.1 hypothetical protein [Kofleriaceae bacterium]